MNHLLSASLKATALDGELSKNVVCTTSFTGREDKARKVESLKELGAEGVVLKDMSAPYQEGYRIKTQVKLKFWKSLSAIAVQNERNAASIGLELICDNGGRIMVGNVAVPANMEMPKAGDIVEIRYLYAYENGGLYQPTLLSIRTDLDASDCLASQREFKKD